MIMRALLGAALTLLVASAAHAQQPTEPTASPSAMRCMMHSMQGQGTQEMQGMQGMQGTQGMQGGMGMHAQGAAAGGGMNMGGAQPDQQGASGMQCDCAGCAARAGFAALLGKGAGALTLTTEQTSELDAIVASARATALAVLTAEQRAALEVQAAAPAGGCTMTQTDAAAEHQH